MENTIDEILSSRAHRIGQFLSKTVQGCYIPAYQRPYSWDKKNISRLFEDVLRGIRQISSRPDTISFLGTIIAINDTNIQTAKQIQRTKFPTVTTIIDGQQRICTILISNIVLHDHIRRIVKRFEGKTETHHAWIYEKCTNLINSLRNTYLLDYGDTTDNYRFYPRVIRAYSDVWSDKQDEAEYESPIAKLIWKYINFTESGTPDQFKLDLENSSNRYKAIDNAFRHIRKEIKRICQSHSDEYGFPQLHTSFEGIRNFAPPYDNFDLPHDVKKYIEEASPDQYYNYFCYLLRYFIFATYLNNHIATTVVTAKNEDDVFDMFESLNTTGELLTAFETLKPKVIERETLSEYKRTNSYKCIETIEQYLNRYHKPDKKLRITSEMLIHFALFETGFKLPKTLNRQRRYLLDEFDKLTALNDIEKNRSFLQSLKVIASFLDKMWDVDKGAKPDFTSLNIDDEEAILGFEILRQLNHSITIAPLSRFYQQISDPEGETNRIQKTKDFVAAIKATVAFSVLWRGAKGTTHNIDSYYRDIMSPGIPYGDEHVPPLAQHPNGESRIVSISNYKRALQLVLRYKGKIKDKEDWVKQASTTPIYQFSKVITRFLIFCASDDTVADETEKGLLVKGRLGTNPLLTLNQWKEKAYFTVEHVAPQSRKTGWEDDKYNDIYNDPKTIHTLGNLILLPKAENEILANRSWEHKKLMYSLLIAKTETEFNDRRETLGNAGLTLSKRANEVIINAKYLGLCKSIAIYDKEWSLEIIEERTRCLAELAWDRLAKWLDL